MTKLRVIELCLHSVVCDKVMCERVVCGRVVCDKTADAEAKEAATGHRAEEQELHTMMRGKATSQ